MTAKEYLSQAFRIDQRINAKIEQVKSLRALSTKATANLSDSPRSPSPNLQPMESVVARITDMGVEINQEIDTLVDLKQEIMFVIKQVENTEYQILLELRYLCYKRWEEIAVAMNYSIRHTHEIHDLALKYVLEARPSLDPKRLAMLK